MTTTYPALLKLSGQIYITKFIYGKEVPLFKSSKVQKEMSLCLEEEVNLLPYNTFNIISMARYFVRIRRESELEGFVHTDSFKNYSHLILGGGSNILLANRAYDGIVLKNEIVGMEVVSHDNVHTTLKVGGGVTWNSLVTHCIDHNLGGLENLFLIPGTVGAAPIQNIGAYGVQISDVLEFVEVIELSNGQKRILSNVDCNFGYRESIFTRGQTDAFILAVILKLTNPPHHRLNTSYGSIRQFHDERGINTPTIRSISEAVSFLRNSKLPDPKMLGNAGSFFKNPLVDNFTCWSIKSQHPTLPTFSTANGLRMIPAAWLIEQCGWKGMMLGRVGVYAHHALILVNFGDGDGGEVLELATRICEDVCNRFRIRLIPEVNILR